ncbi:MAG: hypothetical protein J5718_02150, partial [Lachnospiraceae bacterium]|nr:hypothetical protein [Lachnospiraceae bacterium]
EGSAIITALVVSTVLMVLCLSLLAVSYSLFLSTKDDTSGINYREMLYSSAEALEAEIIDKNNTDVTTGNLAADGTAKLNLELLNSVWKGFTQNGESYIQNPNCGEWLYYDPLATDDHGNLEKCSRYFQLKSIGSVKIVVQFYWQLPWSETSRKWDGTDAQKIGSVLHAIYRLYDNNYNTIVKTEKTYILHAVIGGGSGSGSNGGSGQNTGTTNAGNYTISFANGSNGIRGASTVNNSVNSCFLPETKYDVRANDVVNLYVIFGNCTWFFDDQYTKPYDSDKTLIENLNNYSIQGNDITLYALWEKPPRRVRFIDIDNNAPYPNNPGVCIYKTYVYFEEYVPYDSILGDPTRWKYHLKEGHGASGWTTLFGNNTDKSVVACKYDLDVFAIYPSYINNGGNVPEPNTYVPGYFEGRFYGNDSVGSSTPVTYQFYWERIFSE